MSRRGMTNRIREALNERLDDRKPVLNYFHAYLGDGQGNVVIDPDEPNYVWARSQGRGIVYKVYNSRVPNLNNLPVIVGLDDSTPYRWEVLTVRRGDIDILVDEGMSPGVADGVGPHHWQHEFRRDGTPTGSDVVWVNIQQVTDGLVYPSNPAAMTVEVHKCWYAYGQSFQFFSQTTSGDLSGHAPADAGNARWVLVSIDAATNTLQYTEGDTFPTVLFPTDEADTIPDAPAGSVPLAAIYINDTTTSLTWDNIYDMRLFPYGVSGVVTPTSHRLLEAAVHSDVADNVVSTGDLIFGNGIYPEWDVLTVGLSGQYLRSDGTHPEWSFLLNADLPNPIAFNCPPVEISVDVYGDTTATQNVHTLEGTYLGTADLDTINGLTNCQFLLLKAKTGHTIVLKHGTGNIRFSDGNDYTLSGDVWLLMYYDGTHVTEVGPVSGTGVTWGVAADIQDVDLGAAAAGVLAKAARADHEHKLDESISPTWTGHHTFQGRAHFDDKVLITYAGELTISSAGGWKTITAYDSYHTVDTEGDAASDDLDTILGGVDGDLLILQVEDASRVVTVKDDVININLADGDFVMDSKEKLLFLIYDDDASEWREISRAGEVIAHASQHENGGSDEIDVTGLSGELADAQDADQLQGETLAATTPTTGETLIYTGSQWEPKIPLYLPFDEDGLILLGPSCPIGETFWRSLRGQEATISGAFHQVAGRWPGTRALLIEEAGTNYCLAPRMIDSDSNNVADGWISNNSINGSATRSVIEHPASERGWMQRIEYTGDAADSGEYYQFYDVTASGSFSAGDDCTFSADMFGVAEGITVRLRIIAYASGGGSLGTVDATVTLTADMQRYEVTYESLPASTDYVAVVFRILNIDSGDELDIRFGAVNVEKSDYATTFMHGALPHCSWSGTADQSTTTRTATEVNLDDYATLLSGNDTFSVSLWWQAPFDEVDWPFSGNVILWQSHEDASNYVDIYVGSNGNINARFRESATTVLAHGNYAFEKGEWVHIVATYDTSGDVTLYVQGEELDNTDMSARSSISPTQMNLGSTVAAGAHADAAYSELAIFDNVLTFEEIVAHYWRNTPLVDSLPFLAPVVDGWGFRLPTSDDDVSSPPTDAEITTAFGAQSDGFEGIIDDAGAGTTLWRVTRKNGSWGYEQLTVAT